jgi:uncharacterized membrane protein YgdD (TMEM256/DUF423 family)
MIAGRPGIEWRGGRCCHGGSQRCHPRAGTASGRYLLLMDRRSLTLGALSGVIAVGAGAFGAHALRTRLTPEMLAAFEAGARYQMYHALALVAIGLGPIDGSKWVVWARQGFVVGTILFSGSLYLLALSGARWWGAVTPLGGLAFLAGWGCLAVAGWRHR